MNSALFIVVNYHDLICLIEMTFYLFLRKKNTNIIEYYYPQARFLWPKEYYLSNEINRFKKGKFNNKD